MKLNSIGREEDCEPQVQHAVPAAVSELSLAISALESNTGRLRDRLTPVMSGERDTDGKGQVRPMHSVPLAAELTSLVDRIEALNYRTLDALDRLHV
jgi:hypothetical protein